MRKILATCLATLVCILPALCIPAAGQSLSYGSADDPAEHIPQPWWRSQGQLDVRSGPSLIGPHWRLITGMTLSVFSRPFSAQLDGAVRGGIYGLRAEDADEWYDLVRLIRFARYDAGPAAPVFARIGLIRHMRLGSGQLVDFYQSDVAWDDRSVGAEVSVATPAGRLSALTSDVRLDGLSAARVSSRSIPLAMLPGIQHMELGAEIATNLDLLGRETVADQTAVGLEARLTLVEVGGVDLVSFGGYTSFLHYGDGYHAGLSFESLNLLDLARFHLRMAYRRSSAAFVPGYFGAFYEVHNPRARLVDAEAYFRQPGDAVADTDEPPELLVGLPLEDVERSNSLEVYFRLLIFEQMELRSRFRRHYSDQPLSTFNMRLFYRVFDQFHLDLTFDRTGLTSFLSLFGDLEDQNALRLASAYRALPGVWLHVDARYSYQQILRTTAGTRLYVTQRQFEPTAGLRLVF